MNAMPRMPPGGDPLRDLKRQVAALWRGLDLAHETIELLIQALRHDIERADEIEARLPAMRFEVPRGWITVQQAQAVSAYSLPSLYRMARNNVIDSVVLGGRRFIDPESLSRLRK